MLLVRPDGVLSYYHLREALRGLKIDFGYEFIDKDWVLDFPADDQAPTPQSWVTTTKPVDAPPAPAVASGRRVAGIPTPGQDGPPLSSSAPYPPGSSPGLRGAVGAAYLFRRRGRFRATRHHARSAGRDGRDYVRMA